MLRLLLEIGCLCIGKVNTFENVEKSYLVFAGFGCFFVKEHSEGARGGNLVLHGLLYDLEGLCVFADGNR